MRSSRHNEAPRIGMRGALVLMVCNRMEDNIDITEVDSAIKDEVLEYVSALEKAYLHALKISRKNPKLSNSMIEQLMTTWQSRIRKIFSTATVKAEDGKMTVVVEDKNNWIPLLIYGSTWFDPLAPIVEQQGLDSNLNTAKTNSNNH